MKTSYLKWNIKLKKVNRNLFILKDVKHNHQKLHQIQIENIKK